MIQAVCSVCDRRAVNAGPIGSHQSQEENGVGIYLVYSQDPHLCAECLRQLRCGMGPAMPQRREPVLAEDADLILIRRAEDAWEDDGRVEIIEGEDGQPE